MAKQDEGVYCPVEIEAAAAEASVSEEEQPARSSIFRSRSILVAAVFAVGLIAGIAFFGNVKRSAAISAADNGAVVSFADETVDPKDANKEWAKQLETIKRTDPEAYKQMRMQNNARKARKLIEHVNKQSPEEAHRLVKEAVVGAADRALKKAHERDELLAREETRSLKKRKSVFTRFIKKEQKAPWQRVTDGIRDFHEDKKQLELIRTKQTTQIACVAASMQAAQGIARIAFGVDNAVSTCPNSVGLRNKLCAVNGLLVVMSISQLAANLAGAASACAESTNVRALCAASVTGLVSGLATTSAAGIIIAEGCKPLQQFIKDNAKTGINLGSAPAATNAAQTAPQVQEMGKQGSSFMADQHAVAAVPDTAPARRLFLGGNLQVRMGQCVLDVLDVAWSVVGLGLAIKASTRSCPLKIPTNAQDALQQALLSKATCTIDVSTIIMQIARMSTFLTIGVIQCGGGLNLGAICGAGVSALVLGSSIISRSAAGLYATCDVGIKLATLQDLLKFQKLLSKDQMKDALYNEEVSIGETGDTRRLLEDRDLTFHDLREAMWSKQSGMNVSYKEARNQAGLEDPHDLIAGAKTPREAWQMLGLNMTDSNNDWLRDALPADVDAEAKEAFVRVMKPYMHLVGEADGMDDVDRKWPLWPSPFENEEL